MPSNSGEVLTFTSRVIIFLLVRRNSWRLCKQISLGMKATSKNITDNTAHYGMSVVYLRKWCHCWLGYLPLPNILKRCLTSLTSSGKDQNSKFEILFLLSAYHTANIINQVTISQAHGLGNVYEYRTTCQIFQQTFEVMILRCPWREYQHGQKKIKQSQPKKKKKPTLNGLTINFETCFLYTTYIFLFHSFLHVPQSQPADFFWDKIAGRKVGTVKLKPSVPSCKLQQIFMVEWKKTSWKTRLIMEVLTNPALAAQTAGLLPGP